jgi:hypothetical protein
MVEQNSEGIQQEIALLEQQLAAKRAELGQESDAPYERAEVHAALGERIGQEGAAPSAPPPPAPSAAAGQAGSAASWQDPALAQQVQALVTVAFTQGVQQAIQQAVKTGNAALIDALHDILADELHAELISRQKVAPAS